MVRILSWNVNGLRALLGKRYLREFLDELGADIVCVQETKTTKSQLDCSGAIADGYNSYFSFCRNKTGYSGVATFCKTECTPVAAEEGLTGVLKYTDAVCCYPIQNDVPNELLQEIDAEGRAVMTEHALQDGKSLVVINVYCPRADPDNVERLEYKLRFYDALQRRCQSLQQAGKCVIVLGDINCCYGRIDSAYKEEEEEETESCDEDERSRDWLKSFVLDKGESTGGYKLVDSFRHLHPHTRQAYTCWSTVTSARSTNYGTRIDYILIGQNLVSYLTGAGIMPDVYGSDHCPVYAELYITIKAADKPPSLCSSYWPEFSGKQKKLSACFAIVKRPCEDKLPDEISVKKLKFASKNEQSKNKQGDKQKKLSSYFVKSGNDDLKQELSCQGESKTKPVHNFISEGNFLSKAAAPPTSMGLSKQWQQLLKGPQKPPLCEGHREPCVRRKVKKDGPNFGKEFFVCARPAGAKGNTAARCNHFQWIGKK